MLLTFPLLWGWNPILFDEDNRPNKILLGSPNSNDTFLNYTSYLPATMSIVPQWYASARGPHSLSMMLQPREYRRMTCAQIRGQHQREYQVVSGRNKYNVNQEKDTRGFMFRDPHPVCGRYLLSRLTGGEHRYVFVVRAGRSEPSQLPNVLTVRAGQWSEDVVIEQCGQCVEAVSADACSDDVLFRARLFNANRVLHAEVVPPANGSAARHGHRRVARVVRFRPLDPGDYTLEVKMVHYNGNSDNYKKCRTLGMMGFHHKSKSRHFFHYNGVCDLQRLVYGSPLRVRVLPAVGAPTLRAMTPPFCNISSNYNTSEGGQWVRFVDGADPHTPEGAPHPLAANCTAGDRYCHGNPVSLTDPGGYNNHLVWVPSTCRLRLFGKGSGGPSTACLRTPPFRTRLSEILFAGDSVTREYYRNCDVMRFIDSGSKIHCQSFKLTMGRKTYGRTVALSVIRSTLDIIGSTVGVFVTNMGMQWMIGHFNRGQWVEFVDLFVREWRRRNLTVLRGPYTTMPPFGAPTTVEAPGGAEWQQYMWEQNQRSRAIMGATAGEHGHFPPHVEWAVWLSPPTVQHARFGMTHQREVEWDRLAYERLQKIGFIRLDALTPTHSRQEASWDGLHYLSRANATMSPRRNPRAVAQEFSGGVSFMLFLILLNVLCFS
ncbi:hypothetical protein LSM04_002970 [Trypanosoma melophagium]|uniref:uncharacterized protein n=1 Tax=Trypanosoma melophagium TaxID=715481 RepID=UPI003519E8D3|nr:hypothetical protein LSM04_002970 [Trypanosoma melophagium]